MYLGIVRKCKHESAHRCSKIARPGQLELSDKLEHTYGIIMWFISRRPRTDRVIK